MIGRFLCRICDRLPGFRPVDCFGIRTTNVTGGNVNWSLGGKCPFTSLDQLSVWLTRYGLAANEVYYARGKHRRHEKPPGGNSKSGIHSRQMPPISAINSRILQAIRLCRAERRRDAVIASYAQASALLQYGGANVSTTRALPVNAFLLTRLQFSHP